MYIYTHIICISLCVCRDYFEQTTPDVWPLQGGMDVMELTRLEAPMEIAVRRGEFMDWEWFIVPNIWKGNVLINQNPSILEGLNTIYPWKVWIEGFGRYFQKYGKGRVKFTIVQKGSKRKEILQILPGRMSYGVLSGFYPPPK